MYIYQKILYTKNEIYYNKDIIGKEDETWQKTDL